MREKQSLSRRENEPTTKGRGAVLGTHRPEHPEMEELLGRQERVSVGGGGGVSRDDQV